MAKAGRQPKSCKTGSIEQQLDMCEENGLRGDQVSRRTEFGQAGLGDEDSMQRNYNVDMAEENREGDDLSGDEHSAGLQGGEQELQTQPEPDEGLPGDETDIEEHRVDERRRRTLPI